MLIADQQNPELNQFSGKLLKGQGYTCSVFDLIKQQSCLIASTAKTKSSSNSEFKR